MDDFLQAQFRQNPEVSTHITIYLFDHRYPRVEVATLRQKVYLQSKTISHKDKTCKKLRLRVDSLIDKENRLGKKQDKGLGVTSQVLRVKLTSVENRRNDGY